MELPNRNTLEAGFADELGELTQQQRSRLRELMGTPPDPSRVPESFWEEIRRDTQRRLAAILYLLFIASAEQHFELGGGQASSSMFDTQATAFANTEAQKMANGYANASRERFVDLATKINAPRTSQPELAGPLELDEQEIADEIEDVLSSKSAERIATTSTTAAQTAGGNAGVDAAKGDSGSTVAGLRVLKVWTNHPELTRSGPCPRCEALNGKTSEEWGSIDPAANSGPPLHDYCACTTNYIFTPATEVSGAPNS